MKKVFIFLFLSIIPTLLAGCSTEFLPERVEIDKLTLIRAVGVDKGFKDPSNICITIVSKEVKEGKTGKADTQSQKQEAVVMSNEAATMLEAEREFQTYSDKRMFWGHVDFYLISEDAAREGISKYIDFFARDHEFRDNAKIYIIKDSSAKEFIEKSSTGNYFMPDRLKAIGENSILFTGSTELKLMDFMQWLNRKHSSAIAPVLYLKQKEEGGNKNGNIPLDIELDGYAAFKNLKLVTFINRKLARGENFLLNRVTSGVIQVKDPAGKMVGLDIIDSRTKISTVFRNGELLGMSVKVKLSSNVDEVHSSMKIFTEDTLNFLTQEQSNLIKTEIEQVIGTAKENNADFVDMASVFDTYHPVLWQKYKDRWDEIFPKLPVTVEVDSKINRTYDIREPNGFFEEEHK